METPGGYHGMRRPARAPEDQQDPVLNGQKNLRPSAAVARPASSQLQPSPRIASPPRARRGSTYSPLSGRDDDDRQASRRDSYRREHRGSSSRSRDFDRRGSYPTPPVNVQQPPRMSVLDTREPAIDPAAHQHGLVGTPRAPPPMMQHSYRSPPAHYEPRTPSMHTTTAASTPASASTPFFTIAQSMDERGRSTSNDPLIWGEKGEPWKRASAVSATGVDKQRSSQYSRKPTAQRKDRRCLWIGLVCLAVLIVGGAVGAGVGVAISKHHHDPNRLISGGDDAGVSGQSGLGSASGSDQPDAAPVNTTVPASAANGTTYKTGYSSLVVFGASYCDNGHARPARYQQSLRKPPYVGGRWTNGKVWDEYLAAQLGPNGTSTTLVNYAYGGATIDNAVAAAPVPDLGQQSSAFLSDLAAKSAGAGNPNGKALVAIWMGINSVQGIWNQALRALSASRTSQQSSAALASAQANISASVTELYSVCSTLSNSAAFKGPKPDFLILPLPPAELLLINQEAAHGNNASLTLVKTLNDEFNAQLLSQMVDFQATLAEGQKLLTYDVATWWQGLYDDPAKNGLTTSTAPCLDEWSGNAACANPSSYLFWDNLHPVTTVHQRLATLLLPTILPPSSSSSS